MNKFCEECGHPFSGDQAKFCSQCGTKRHEPPPPAYVESVRKCCSTKENEQHTLRCAHWSQRLSIENTAQIPVRKCCETREFQAHAWNCGIKYGDWSDSNKRNPGVGQRCSALHCDAICDPGHSVCYGCNSL